LTIEYDGTGYAGWQVQPHQKTIQGAIEHALKKVLSEKINVTASGRTDAGVHAKAQTANFRTKSVLPLEKIKNALNANLPEDIVIKDCCQVPLDFNARFSAKSKIYRYTIQNSSMRTAIGRQYVCRIAQPLNINLMKKEACALLGKKDFRSFHAAGRKINNFVRHIKRIDIKKGSNSFILIDIEADGFLYNMARNIVGTLVEVARLKRPQGSTKYILRAKNRNLAGPTMPAKGLCLLEVKY